jgi:hypothetical protein
LLGNGSVNNGNCYVISATYMHVTIEKLLEAVFSVVHANATLGVELVQWSGVDLS